MLDGGTLGSSLFNSLLGMSFSLIGVDSVSLLAGVSQCLVGVSTAVFLHIDGSSVEVASSESDSLGSGVVVVGELRNSASLLGGVLLDDSVVCGLVLVSLSMEPEGLWEGRWLSWILGVVLVPSGMSSEEIFSWGLVCIVIECTVMNLVLLGSWLWGSSSWSSSRGSSGWGSSWSLCFGSLSGLGSLSSSLSSFLGLFGSGLDGLLTSWLSWGGSLSSDNYSQCSDK